MTPKSKLKMLTESFQKQQKLKVSDQLRSVLNRNFGLDLSKFGVNSDKTSDRNELTALTTATNQTGTMNKVSFRNKFKHEPDRIEQQ